MRLPSQKEKQLRGILSMSLFLPTLLTKQQQSLVNMKEENSIYEEGGIFVRARTVARFKTELPRNPLNVQQGAVSTSGCSRCPEG
jgi:hypothetical protein